MDPTNGETFRLPRKVTLSAKYLTHMNESVCFTRHACSEYKAVLFEMER